MDVCKYQNIIEACQLQTDYNLLPGGDQTEIGERVRILIPRIAPLLRSF